MPIREITEDTLRQVCIKCDETIPIPIGDLSVGIKLENQIEENVIKLPPCPTCGSVEFFIPSSEGEPSHPNPGCYGHLHRMLVDLLHDRLVESGNVQEGMDPEKIKSCRPKDEDISRWFNDGLVLERPKKMVENQEGSEALVETPPRERKGPGPGGH